MRPNAQWGSRDLRPASTRRGLSTRIGDVAVIEGDATLISGEGTDLGLRFDETTNDLGSVMGRYVEDFGDAPGLLVLFTTFADHGAGGPAYFVPVFNQTEGTGMGPIDQRARFSTSSFEGFINMKQPSGHEDLLTALAHEVAHRHLAYMQVAPVGTATSGVPLLGRQGSHWNAALDADGSLLEGYDWRESGEGRFVAVGYSERFSLLDLYGLGLIDESRVLDFFFIEGAKVESGAALPPAAQVPLGTVVSGTRVDLSIDDVVAALGARPLERRRILLSFAVLTRPDQAADAAEVVELVQQVSELATSFPPFWADMTSGLGEVCAAPCAPPATDAGSGTDSGPTKTKDPEDEGCSCQGTRGPQGAPAGLLVLALLLRARTRVRGRPKRASP